MSILILKLSISIHLLHLLNGFYSNKSSQERDDHDYERMILAVCWSPSKTCKNFFNNDKLTTCSSCRTTKVVNKWTIHGLWPSNRYVTSPINCRNNPFDASLLNDKLKSQMKNKWPSADERTDEVYWSHEWTKHGACGYHTKDTNTMEKFFSKTVELYDRYDIRKILDDSGIVPNDKYRTEDIHMALKNSLGVKAFVACKFSQQFQQQFLLEINICFDKSLSLVDCEDTSTYLHSCTRDYEVSYLESC